MTEKEQGHVLNLTVEILKQIRDGVSQTNKRLDDTNRRLEEGFYQLNARIDKLNGRFDHFLDLAGGHYRDHEKRIRAIERKVFPARRP